MQYTTTINDEVVFGITGARNAYNAALPQEIEVTPADGETPAVMGPNPELINNNAGYIDYILTRAVESWCKQYPETEVVIPAGPSVVVNGVPQQVYRTQAKKALALAGLLESVETTIANMPGQEGVFARIDWADSLTFNRDNPLIISMGTILGLTSEQLDQLFITAATL